MVDWPRQEILQIIFLIELPTLEFLGRLRY